LFVERKRAAAGDDVGNPTGVSFKEAPRLDIRRVSSRLAASAVNKSNLRPAQIAHENAIKRATL
jgi:hypothetical protein